MSIFKPFIHNMYLILNVVLFAFGGALGVSAAFAISFWLFAYLPNPSHPYIDGSPFTLAQVAAIFGGLGLAAGFSGRVDGRLRILIRLTGVLYLVSALGFSLFGMTLPLSADDAQWKNSGHVLEKMHFAFLLMAMGGFSLGTMIWVSSIHRLLGFQATPPRTKDWDNMKARVQRMKLSKRIRSMGTPAKAVGRGLLYYFVVTLVVTLAIASFHPALLADAQGRPILGHITLVIWAVAAMLVVGIRSRIRKKPPKQCIFDGIVAAAITYAAVALVSQVLQDMASELEGIRMPVLWQIVVIIELFVVSVGTVFLINLSTARKGERTFHVGGPE